MEHFEVRMLGQAFLGLPAHVVVHHSVRIGNQIHIHRPKIFGRRSESFYEYQFKANLSLTVGKF